MASQKKGKMPATKFWQGIRKKGRSLLSIPALQLRSIRERYRRWPRFLQVCSLYLLVLLFAGAVFVWRSAQLRTINPYIENIKFSEPEDDYPLEKNGKKKEPGGEKDGAGAETEETATAGAGGDLSKNNPPEIMPEMSWPVSSREVIHQYNSIQQRWPLFKYYRALGIKASPGEEVRSISKGTVKGIGDHLFPYGKTVIIEHEGNYKAYYGALEESKVKKGDTVDRGQVIATVKKNPEGKETYLHLEIEEKGKHVDPESILR